MSSTCSAFASDRRGNFAILTATLSVPMLFAAAYMIDVSMITRTKTELQQALDAAVLAVAREGKDISLTDAEIIAKHFLDTNLPDGHSGLAVKKDGTRFTVEADTKAPMAFGGLLGYSSWPVKGKATADIAYASYEIALVLDTTGSMAGGKLSAMKDAVLGLIDTMATQVKDPEKLKFATVPFNNFVNVGAGFGPNFDKNGKQIAGTGANWLDLKGASDFPQSELAPSVSRFQLYSNVGQKWPGCVETRHVGSSGSLDVDDTAPDWAKAETLFVPAFAIDEPESNAYGNSYIVSNAKPAVQSVAEKRKRLAKYGVATDTAGNPLLDGVVQPVTQLVFSLGRLIVPIDTGTSPKNGMPKGPGNGCNVAPITPLTNDYAGLKAKVNSLVAAGTTNIMEGVAWGNRVLSPGAPFGESAAKTNNNLDRIMVVLTDGSNVFGNAPNDLGSSYSSQGYLVDGRLGIAAGGSSATNTLMNARTLAACQVAKDAGIEVYTIRLEEPNVATGTMLKECASDPDHYFDVPNRTQLDEAFGKIRDRIVKVRISS